MTLKKTFYVANILYDFFSVFVDICINCTKAIIFINRLLNLKTLE